MNRISERHSVEAAFFDEHARHDNKDFYSFGALRSADEYLWESLGDVGNKRILEIGCGDGSTSVRLAKAGALVTCIDISGEMIELTKRKASENSLVHRIHAIRMGGEDIDLLDHSFDIIYGHSVLHHLNLEIAVPKMIRILAPKGRAIFLEPLSHNPLLKAFRFLTPHRRTSTEQPLTLSQIEAIASQFTSYDHKEFYLLSLLSFVWYYGVKSQPLFQGMMSFLERWDRHFFSLFPSARKWAWVTVLRFLK